MQPARPRVDKETEDEKISLLREVRAALHTRKASRVAGKSAPPTGRATSRNLIGATAPAALATLAGKLGPDPTNAAIAAAHGKKLATTEKPDLTDPANEDPEALLAYQADDDDFQVTVIPRTATAAVKRRVAACIQYYGLNREELCELRYDLYETLAEAREDLAEPGLPAARRTKILKRLERFVDKKRQFAGMARYYLIDTWKLLPATLRTPS